MCTPGHIQDLTERIEALGLGPDLAEECVARIGDTPFILEGDLWVTDAAGAVIAVIPERLLSPERAAHWPWQGVPDVILMRGRVDTKAEHVAVCAGRRVLARLAPKDPRQPEAGLYLLEWRVPPGHRKSGKWTLEVEGEISCMFTGKGETSPWGYLLYHCGTTGNACGCLNGGTCFARMPGTRRKCT
jgi:hypothetical protein